MDLDYARNRRTEAAKLYDVHPNDILKKEIGSLKKTFMEASNEFYRTKERVHLALG